VYELAQGAYRPVFSPRYAGAAALLDQPADKLGGVKGAAAYSVFVSKPGRLARAQRVGSQNCIRVRGRAFDYLLEAGRLAGLGVAIAPPATGPLTIVAAGRLAAPWGFCRDLRIA